MIAYDKNWHNIADNMMKFTSYETIVELLYKHAIPTPKEQCSKPLQLGVSFAGGYIAGVFCAVVSHPADNLVSFLNNAQGVTISDVSEVILFLLVHILFLLIYPQETIKIVVCT